MQSANKLLAIVFVLLMAFAFSACGGGGGGHSPTLAPPPANQQNLGTGGGDNSGTPPEPTPPEVTVPEVAKSAGEIGGVLADAEGNPVGDLEVYLDSVDNVVSSTDENGEFVISGVSAGEHVVLFGIEGEEVASFTVADYDESAPLNEAFVATGVRTTSAVNEPGSLRGRVTEPNDEPIPGVKVLVFDREGFFVMRRTNDDGVYEFGHLPPGEYWLLGFKRGYRTHVGQVSIESGQTTTHDFTMAPIPVGGVEGVVTDEEHNPIPATHVFLLYRERRDNANRPPAFHTTTDHQGYYKFEPVPAGGADMLAFHPGFMPADAEVEIPVNETIQQNFVLHPMGPPPPPPAATLSGKVFGPNETPIPEATIALLRFDGERWETLSGEDGYYEFLELTAGPYHYEVSKEGFEDNRGQLMLGPGENHRDFFLHPAGPPPDRGAIFGTVYRPRNDGSDGDRWPVPGADVALFHGPPEPGVPPIQHTRTNERGRYAFNGLPPSGDLPYVVVAHKDFEDGPWEGAEDTHLRQGETVTLDIMLHPAGGPPPEGGTIFGLVWRECPERPDHEQPVPGAWVKLYHGEPDPNAPPLRVTETDERGMYCFEQLPPSGDLPYVLIAGKHFDDGMLWIGDAATHLRAGEEKRVNIQLHPQGPPPEFGSVEGAVWRIIEGNEEVVPGALVLLFHGEPGPNNPPLRETRTNHDGRYCFVEVPPSGPVPYFLIAKKRYGNILWQGLEDFHLAPGENKEVNIQIFPEGPPPPEG